MNIKIVRKLISSIFRRKDPSFVLRQVRDPDRYAREKALAQSGDAPARLALARNMRTHQEILYYMAENDPDARVRQAVARNLATPVQASIVMSSDPHEDVRLALAERLVRLLPALSRDDYTQLYAVAVQTLGALAKDEVLKIRIALSSALRDHAKTPPPVAAQLARDVERKVAEPILRFCAALDDDVLLGILEGASQGWILEAIASRKTVSEAVSVAIIQKEDIPSGKALISNPGAQLGRDLLMDIVERARTLPEWQEPLALRKGLPDDVAVTLAAYAEESVRKILARRSGFSQKMTRDVVSIVKRRLSKAIGDDIMIEEKRETPYDRAVRMARAGTLDEDAIIDALALHEDEFVVAAMACLARISLPKVKYILSLRAAKPIIALCWRAGLSMRVGLKLQQGMGRVPFREVIYPRDGVEYPVSDEDIRWHADYLGIAGEPRIRVPSASADQPVSA